MPKTVMSTSKLSVVEPANEALSRYEQVDAFRAYALFGLFIVHCVELFELHWSDPQPSLWFDWVFFVFGGKAFAMFALSFGLSFAIIVNRAKQRGEEYSVPFLWRSVLLVLIGLAHTVIYRGDILVILGLLGLLMVPLNRLTRNGFLFVLAAVFLLNLPLLLRLVTVYLGSVSGLAVLTEANNASMAAYLSGGVGESIAANLGSGNVVKWVYMLESGRVAQIFGLFVCGLILGRMDFFTDLARFQRVRWCLAVSAGLGATLLHHYQAEIIASFPATTIGETQFYKSSLVAGWVNLLMMMCQTMMFFELWYLMSGRCLRWLAPLGRMTLTLYVGQSIVFVPILYNMGLGLYDDVTAQQMFWIGIVTFTLQWVFATTWLRRFHYGPLEWGWRAATKLSWAVPMRRAPQ